MDLIPLFSGYSSLKYSSKTDTILEFSTKTKLNLRNLGVKLSRIWGKKKVAVTWCQSCLVVYSQFYSRTVVYAEYTQPIGNLTFSEDGPIYLPDHQTTSDATITYIPDRNRI